MLNIKTSNPYDLKPVELTPAELDSVAGGNPVAVGITALVVAAAAIKWLRGSKGKPSNGGAANDVRYALAARAL
jgi:hypothetical protein